MIFLFDDAKRRNENRNVQMAENKQKMNFPQTGIRIFTYLCRIIN